MLGVVTVLALLAVVAVLFVAAAAATQDGDLLVDAPADAADHGLPAVAVQPEDVADVRFGMALRGYRMAEVDEVLDRLAQELSSRNQQIADLQRAVAAPAPTPTAAAPEFQDDFPEVLPPEPLGLPQVPQGSGGERPHEV